MKSLPRGVTALEVLIAVALVAFLNLLAAQHYRVQLARLMAQWSELAEARDRVLLDDGRVCAAARWDGDVAGCRSPGR
jgi:type II secretory pathway component PulJ